MYDYDWKKAMEKLCITGQKTKVVFTYVLVVKYHLNLQF